ncbi:hypothetical protein [Devosia sp. Leaf64]|uniref:hypothetical protein n=1 Tax=Devosia sp. Leaf64 TaxID=1736229 RepID=UPI000715D623|nr:hypothetical protein [Devosia sp. Leaf64]KQN69820.1 hypothetical protein ASE94_12015 [Devosia sp. Leaf64]
MLPFALATASLAGLPVVAETYILPIEFPRPILNDLVDNGSAELVEQNGTEWIYRLEMKEGVCTTRLIVINHFRPLFFQYDLCSGKLIAKDNFQ